MTAWRWHEAVQKPGIARLSIVDAGHRLRASVEGSTVVIQHDFAGSWVPLSREIVQCADRDAAAALATAWLLEVMR